MKPNHRMAQARTAEVHYPELQPLHRYSVRRSVQSKFKKQPSQAQHVLCLIINAALIFGLFQCVRAVISDGFDLSILLRSQASVQQYLAETKQEHQVLRNKIRIYSSPSGIEELARNYLNMVGENELPVRYR